MAGNQAAGGYVDYDAASDRFMLNDVQALCLADPNGPVDLPGAYSIVEDTFHVLDRTLENFRSGNGMEWGDHHKCLFSGTERFFRAGYHAHLLTEWLPALDGVVDKLNRGAKVADIGCGHGASTTLMAKAFPIPSSSDRLPRASIEVAAQRAREAGAATPASRRRCNRYGERGFDPSLLRLPARHGRSAGAARHAFEALNRMAPACWSSRSRATASRQPQPGGPRVLRRVLADLRAGFARPHGPALGAQAGEARLRDVLVSGGFTRVRRAAETPFNIVLEARP